MKVEYIDHMGTDESVVRAARVSFAADKPKFYGIDGSILKSTPSDPKELAEQDAKLIKYLAKHNHWTPFAHTSITLRMTAPVPIRTQCFKHKQGFAENEESRRYISGTPEYFIPTFRTQADNKKQGSGGDIVGNVAQQEEYVRYMDSCIEMYEAYLEAGIAEEQARFVLPQGCMVNWYWTGSLAAFSRFYSQRTDPHAQLEIQQLAKMVGDIIQPLYPVSWAALTGETL